MSHPTSNEDGLAVLRAAWSNASISHERQGAIFALRNPSFDPDQFGEILEAMRAMPRENENPPLEVIQLVWRIPAQMMLYRGYFSEHQPGYDEIAFNLLIEATKIIGVVLNED